VTGVLYVVGIGPGDPELLTLKAVRVLKEVQCLFFPKGREEGISLARSIVEKVIDLSQKEVHELHFPMAKKGEEGFSKELMEKWEDIASKILSMLKQGRDAAFLTLGDPCLYSTYFYVHHILEKDSHIQIQIIPGISSVNLAFSELKRPMVLGDEGLVIVPATYWEAFELLMDRFQTIVFMKVYKVFSELFELISKKGLLNNAYYVSRLGMKDQKILRDLREVREQDLNYFSIVIVKKEKR